MNMFEQHRKNLVSLFPKKEKAVIFIRAANMLFQDDTDYEYLFRQESNFYYLTGIMQPGLMAVIEVPSGKYHLIFPERSYHEQIFSGLLEVPEKDSKILGADHGHAKSDFKILLKKIGARKIYTLWPKDKRFLPKTTARINAEHLLPRLHSLRRVKDAQEMALIREANQISGEAHQAVMQCVRPGMHEYELKAIFDAEVGKRGALRQAYEGIFASGKNAAVLHYVLNDQKIRPGDMVLVDAAAEWKGYASDITRTFPANGKFSHEQAELYDIILHAQKTAIKMVRPGVSIIDLHLAARRIILGGLLETGFLRGTLEDLVEHNIGSVFFPHGLGHLLGVDTHDVGGKTPNQNKALKNLRFGSELEPGMVLTIEPGLYFIAPLLEEAVSDPEKTHFFNKQKIAQYRNFGGIRIEDNVVVTANGHRNLTTVPKERKEIESLMGG